MEAKCNRKLKFIEKCRNFNKRSKSKNVKFKKEAQHPITSNKENNLHKLAEQEEVGEDGHQMVSVALGIWWTGSHFNKTELVGTIQNFAMCVHGQGSARIDTDRKVFACPQLNGLYEQGRILFAGSINDGECVFCSLN